MKTVEIARTQIGVAEATGNNDGVPAERYNRGEKVPWCSSFILYCNDASTDRKIVKTPAAWWLLRSVQTLEDELRAAGWWFSQQALLLPASNDIVFFANRGGSDVGPHSGGRHVGIIDSVQASSKQLPLPGVAVSTSSLPVLHTIEGNLGNAVATVRHDLKDPAVRARITGYARIPTA